MEILTTLSIFIILVIIGSVLSNKFTKIPAALFQIILGAAVALLPIHLNFEFESETFMALVIAPLLFTDAFKSSRKNLWLYKKPILYMAIGLVIFTVIIVGSFINFIIPAITLSSAFALAAILSPTDAVAVKSITKGMKLPKGLMSILEGESLLNDAAGLVSFNIALAAILTGTFSLGNATEKFLVAAIGGAIIGLILGVIFSRLKQLMIEIIGDEVSIFVIFQIMIPIVTYFIAEHFHVSGIIAVVITGIIFNFEKDLFQRDSLASESSVMIESTQSSMAYILNGFVFVFLGYLLPDIYKNMIKFPELPIRTAIIYTILIALALVITRFVFVYVFYIQFQQHSFATARKTIKVFKERKLDVGNYSRFEYSIITSLCGIHGTVTMATALLIPVYLNNGDTFPLRNAILFIASGVVLLSMIIGTILLPILVKSTEENDYLERKAITENILDETIKELKGNFNENSSDSEKIAFGVVIKKLQEQQVYYSDNEVFLVREVQRIYKAVVKAENDKINNLAVNSSLEHSLIGVLKLMQLRRTKLMTYSVFKQIILQFRLSAKEALFKRMRVQYHLTDYIIDRRRNSKRIARLAQLKETMEELRQVLPTITNELNNIAFKTICEETTEENELAAKFVYDTYKNFAASYFQSFISNSSFEDDVKSLEMEAIQLQKYRVMYMKKMNIISHEDADILLRDLNYNESLLFIPEED